MTAKKGRVTRAKTPMSKWIRLVRTMNDLEQSEFAAHIGKSRSAVAMYESGTPVPTETIALIRTTFVDAPPPPAVGSDVVVLGHARGEEGNSFIPYAGIVPCSSQWGDPLSSEDKRPVEYKFTGEDRFLCKVVGDSCYPALQQGDMTVWERDQNPPYGVIVLAERLEDQACTVKELQYSAADARNMLVPVNPRSDAPLDGEGWACTARLVGVIRQGDGPERTWYWAPGLRPKHLLD